MMKLLNDSGSDHPVFTAGGKGLGREGLWVLLILLGFGVCQSIIFFGYFPVPNPDFTQFLQTGRELISLRVPSSFNRGPLYSIILAGLSRILGGEYPELRAGWIVNAVLHPLNLVLIWLISREIIGRAAVWIALLAAVNPWVIMTLALPLAETTLVFFILATYWCLWRGSRWAYFFAACASLVRYEAAFLIPVVLIVDLRSASPRRRFRPLLRSFLASLSLTVWMLGTILHWAYESQNHYVTRLMPLTWERLTRALLFLWQAVFFPLVTSHPDQPIAAVPFIFVLWRIAAAAAFGLGIFFALRRREGKVGLLLVFAFPYFIIHVVYMYMVRRFYVPVSWIILVICWYGIRSGWETVCRRLRPPRIITELLTFLILILGCLRLVELFPCLPAAACMSPASAPLFWIFLAVIILLTLLCLKPFRLRIFTVALVAAVWVLSLGLSNQMILSRHLGTGSRRSEFKALGEWYAARARPGDKLAVYLYDLVGYLSSGSLGPVVKFPPGDNPRQFADACREEGITYLVWASREGKKKNNPVYIRLGLDKNLDQLSKPRSVGPYEFVVQLRGERGHLNIFRISP